MNATPVPAGFPWTAFRVDNRAAYMSALESASSGRNIVPFAKLAEGEALASRKTCEPNLTLARAAVGRAFLLLGPHRDGMSKRVTVLAADVSEERGR